MSFLGLLWYGFGDTNIPHNRAKYKYDIGTYKYYYTT